MTSIEQFLFGRPTAIRQRPLDEVGGHFDPQQLHRKRTPDVRTLRGFRPNYGMTLIPRRPGLRFRHRPDSRPGWLVILHRLMRRAVSARWHQRVGLLSTWRRLT